MTARVGTTINNYARSASRGTNTSNTAIYGGFCSTNSRSIGHANGVLVLASGGISPAVSPRPTARHTYLNAGGFNINGTVTSSNVVENAATWSARTSFAARCNAGWHLGQCGRGDVTAGSTLFINNTADHDLYNCGFTNHGSVIWTQGAFAAARIRMARRFTTTDCSMCKTTATRFKTMVVAARARPLITTARSANPSAPTRATRWLTVASCSINSRCFRHAKRRAAAGAAEFHRWLHDYKCTASLI